jgi:hypothetical protein
MKKAFSVDCQRQLDVIGLPPGGCVEHRWSSCGSCWSNREENRPAVERA